MTDPVDLLALARETLEKHDKVGSQPIASEWSHQFCADYVAFIAHARTAAPLLAAEVVRVHEAIGKLPQPVHVTVPSGADSMSDWLNHCPWCKAEWDYEIGVKPQRHPANGCLALLVGKDAK